MSKFFHFATKKLYFKRSFNNISGNCGPLFSQINFDQTYFGAIFVQGVLARGSFCPGRFCLGGLCPRTRLNRGPVRQSAGSWAILKKRLMLSSKLMLKLNRKP